MQESPRASSESARKLHLYEERFKTIFENAPVMIDSFDSQGRCLLWNRECEKNLGWTQDEIIASDDPLALAYPNPKERDAVIEQIKKSDGKFREYDVRTKGGSTRTQLWADFRLPEGGKISVGYDITERRRAERKLAESEEKYRAIFSEARDGIVLIESNTGQIVDCNPEFERQTGRSRQQLKKRKIWELRPTQQVTLAKKTFQKIQKKGHGGSTGLNFAKPDGEITLVDSLSRLVTIGGKRFTISITRDITERKRVEEELRENRARTEAILASALDSIITIDDGGRILEFNAAAEKTFGYPRSEVIGRELAEVIVPPSLRERHREGLRRYTRTGEASVLGSRLETTAMRADGTEFPVELAITRIGQEDPPVFTAFLRDITKRKETVAALKESEEKYRAIFKEARDGIVLVDDDGQIVDCNPEFEQQTGRGLEELRQMKVWQLRPSGQTEGAEALFQKLREEGVVGAREQYFRKPNGETTVVELRGRKIIIGGRELNQGITRDITKRKQTEEALRERDVRLRIMVEQMPAVLWTTDSELRFLSSVGAGLKALNLAPNEVVGKTLYEFFETDDPDFLPIAMHRKALMGESVTYKSSWGDNTFESHTEPLRNEDGNVVGCVGIALDITETLRAGDYLRKSEERYSKLFHYSNDGVIVHDFDGSIIDINEKALDQLGYEKSEILQLKIMDLIGEECYPLLQSEFENLFREGFVRFEASFHRKDRDVFLGEVSASIVQIADRQVIQGIVRDITERKRAEDDLRKSEERYSNLFHYSNDGVYVYGFDGKILDVNEKGLEQLGYAKSEMLKLRIKDLTPTEALPLLRSELDNLFTEGFVRFEANLKRKDGTVFLGEVSGSIVQIADRQVIQGIVRDITERKRAEEEVRKSHEQLRAFAARLQTVREEESTSIAREIHDELGQTLTGLKMDVSWLQRRIAELCDRDEGKEILEILKTMSGEVDGTIQRVRKISTQLRPVVLDDLGLVGALEWQAKEFSDRTGISCEFNTEGKYDLDSQRSTAVFRIFQEILTNVTRHAAADKVTADLNNEDSTLVMTVSDNGRGISQDDIESSRALGILGMRERAQVCGGGVDIRNNNGRGTRVTVRIPMAQV